LLLGADVRAPGLMNPIWVAALTGLCCWKKPGLRARSSPVLQARPWSSEGFLSIVGVM
jgi:hypothetical protein